MFFLIIRSRFTGCPRPGPRVVRTPTGRQVFLTAPSLGPATTTVACGRHERVYPWSIPGVMPLVLSKMLVRRRAGIFFLFLSPPPPTRTLCYGGGELSP